MVFLLRRMQPPSCSFRQELIVLRALAVLYCTIQKKSHLVVAADGYAESPPPPRALSFVHVQVQKAKLFRADLGWCSPT